MTEFLQHSEVIDWQTPAVTALAESLARGASDEEEIARRCFLWVRDEVRHTCDFNLRKVTCNASDVLRHRTGFCYAKSHLLVALLRARGIPAALCYQRLALDASASAFCLHGMVAVFLRRHGWYRVDPRGEKPGVTTGFCPPIERLAFTPRLPGELDLPGRFADPLPTVLQALHRCETAVELIANLPDFTPP